MKYKKLISLFLLTLLVLAMTACTGTTVVSSQSTSSSVDTITSSGTTQQITSTTVSAADVEYDSEDLELNPSIYTLSYISLEGSTVTTSGSGVTADGSIVTIVAPGAYSISGTLTDGQINVDTQEDGTVVLLLNEAHITSSTSAPIYVRNADKVIIHLAEGTQNTVTDGAAYILEDPTVDEPNAAIFSKDDLVIN
ncbi:carbohydrate-binding domain-containing protein, partial [bacterium]|nr:carbohydrate-binding domain-containing protein [bacterium]